jgi:hypothetical protein
MAPSGHVRSAESVGRLRRSNWGRRHGRRLVWVVGLSVTNAPVGPLLSAPPRPLCSLDGVGGISQATGGAAPDATDAGLIDRRRAVVVVCRLFVLTFE